MGDYGSGEEESICVATFGIRFKYMERKNSRLFGEYKAIAAGGKSNF